LPKTEILVGGWAKIYKKDQRVAPRISVSFEEYVGKKKDGSTKYNWAKMPATMIRKVALVHALREAFPDDFQGLYDEAEMGIDMKTDALEKKEPKKVESKPNPASTQAVKPDPVAEKKDHPASREGITNEILALCKGHGCQTPEDAKALTGCASLKELSLGSLKELKRKLISYNDKKEPKKITEVE